MRACGLRSVSVDPALGEDSAAVMVTCSIAGCRAVVRCDDPVAYELHYNRRAGDERARVHACVRTHVLKLRAAPLAPQRAPLRL